MAEMMSNNYLREKRLSLKAKGLLSLMLSLPEDADFSILGLSDLSRDGKDSVIKALAELEILRYFERTQAVDEKGRFIGYNYKISEYPIGGIR